MLHRQGLALLALALTGAVAAHSAQATAPGRAGRIVYVSEPAFNGAFAESVLPAGGGSKRLSGKLPHGSYGPSLAPDGKRIALTIQKPDARHVQILSGGKLRDVARGRAPAWSPDGRTLVYARPSKGRQALWTIDADGTGSRVLVRGAFATQPSFAPDGRHIAYVGFDAKGRMGIWVAGADGRGAHPLYRAPGQATLLHSPVYAPDGRSMAFVLQGAWQHVAAMRADGGGVRLVSPRTRFIGGIDWARA